MALLLVDPAEFPDVQGDDDAEENGDGGDGDHGGVSRNSASRLT
jgi:hypothetical protein